MDFGKLHKKSVNIGKDWKQSKAVGCVPENAGCIPLAVVIMTTANGLHSTFTGRNLIYFLNVRSLPSDSRSLPKLIPTPHELF